MPLGNWNLEWLNHNSQRAWPLAEDASAQDASASLRLPTDFLVDLAIDVPVDVNVQPSRFFLKQLGVTPVGFTITFGYQPASGSAIDMATVSFARSGWTKNKPYLLSGVGDFTDVAGHLVIGSLDAINQQPQGFFDFTLDDGRLEVEVIRPQIRTISAMQTRSGLSVSRRLQDVIELVAGSNMRITAYPENPPRIRFDAVEGAGLTDVCDCDESPTGPPIRFINNIGPDATGNIDLLPGNCIAIEEVTHGLRITDTCAQPCCGCPELEKITQDFQRVRQGQATLESVLSRLQSSVDLTNNVILSSRLLDNGCFTP